MKSLLIGNGINIQFGGKAYSNYFIMERIRYRAKLESYSQIFGNVLKGEEIIRILNDFVDIGNDIRNGNYDKYVEDEDIDAALALDDFKYRYDKEIYASHEIMLEDWFFILHMFFLKNDDLKAESTAAIQAFEHLILDAINNGGKIQELYSKMPKKAKRFFSDFDNVFTLNYDNNIERLTKKDVYHLHGDFSILANSKNPNNVLGYINTIEKNIVVVNGMEHCSCNALLNYSGKLKYKTAKESHDLIVATESNIQTFATQLSTIQDSDPLTYKMIMTKIAHPELNMATEYYFEKFGLIEDELYIVGMSPNNDGHIFDLILKNKHLTKVHFYYFSEAERNLIEQNYPSDLFECESVNKLWDSLDCKTTKYKCKYFIPSEIDKFIDCCNAFSNDTKTKEEILEEISQIPQFEMDRLCQLVKDDLLTRNPEHKLINKDELTKSNASINYIALQEGVLGPALYLICFMNFNKTKV